MHTPVQDIVFLQEVFMEADVSILVSAAKDGKLANAHFFQGGMLHGELLLLTAYPIAEVESLQNRIISHNTPSLLHLTILLDPSSTAQP